MGEAGSKAYLTDVSDEEWVFVLPYLLSSRSTTGAASTSCGPCLTVFATSPRPGMSGA